MKKNKLLYLFLALLCVWTPVFIGFRYSQQIRTAMSVLSVQVWDEAKPATSTSLRNSNPEILANWTALENAITQDHEFSTGGTNSGEHKQIKFNVPITTPTNAANKGWLYSKDVSAVVELHWEDESGNELQMSSGGDLFSSTGLVVTGTSTLNGSLTLSAGNDLLLSTTSDITISGNTFTVAGATGNTLIAGTLEVTGTQTFTGAATFTAGLGAVLPAGSNKITGLADGTADAEAVNLGQYEIDNVDAASAQAGSESVTLPNGLTMKFGTESVAADTTDEITYGDAFDGGVLAAFGTYSGVLTNNLGSPGAQPKSGSETTILQLTNADDGTRVINWFVIGF